jgi:hypothetical protein
MKPSVAIFLVLFPMLPSAAEQNSPASSAAVPRNRDSSASVRSDAVFLGRDVVRPAFSWRSEIDYHGSVEFNQKEIKTAAGAAGDVSRYLATLPSVVSSLGEKFDNTLYVRGGRPWEVVFFVDGIELENINHFSQSNGSGGPIGFINSDYIKSVRFFAGDIPVSYSPRLSSVVDIDMKAGSFSSFNGNVGIKLTGGLASIEGPVPGAGGSFALAGRYVDFSTMRFIIGNEGIPQLGDLLGKIIIVPSRNLVVSATGIFSYNTFRFGYPVVEQGDDGSVHGNKVVMKENIIQGGAGLLVRYKDDVWENRVQLSYSQRNGGSFDSLESFADSFFVHRYSKNPVRGNADNRSHLSLNTRSQFNIDKSNSVDAGVRAYNTRYTFSVSEQAMNSGTCVVCRNDTPITVAWTQLPREKTLTVQGVELGAFASHSLRLEPFSGSTGIRVDYFNLLGDYAFSPKVAGMISLGAAGSVVGGFGLYHQFPTELPTILFNYLVLNSGPDKDSLQRSELSLLRQAEPLRCWQGTLGYHISPMDLLVVKCEFYYKWYDREYRFIAPEVQDVVYKKDNGEVALQTQNGRRRVYGVEVSLANAKRGWLTYSLGASLFDVKNQFENTGWYNDWTNVGYTFSCAATATFFRDHAVSLSLSGSGGRPYHHETVFTDCIGRKTAVLDAAEAYYSRRLQGLLTANVRYGFTRKILGAEVETFVEIINLFNYKPVLEYKFNGAGFQEVTPFGITPIVGCSVWF